MSEKLCPECPPRGAPPYMVTFGDMMSLLFAFFVMLVSMANFETAKFKLVSESISGAFGVLQSFPTIAINPFVAIPRQGGHENARKASINDAKKLQKIMESKGLDKMVQVEVTESGIAILLRDPVSFESGSSEVKAQGQAILSDVAESIKGNPNLKVRVEGHTDDVPIHTAHFRSNWELSAERANATRRLLVEHGLGETRFRRVTGAADRDPLVPEDPLASANRRVAITVLKTDISAGRRAP